MTRFGRWQDLILPVGIISSLLVILVPLPTFVIDLMLAGNITIAVIVLLTTVYVQSPLEFSIFPSLLLATTLGRLVLNVASTRLILTRAETDQLEAAGGVIRSFGEFVAGDKIVVGLIIFVIIIAIQFLVITKGATRISEVAARFALDGMPGKQMAIDADLNAGIIDEKEAQQRREEVTSQADFYGAMDGASKFVRGDAIAGIVITVINIIGGLIIGILQAGMNPADAAQLFTKLTIGDGLVSQVPAFLVSLAAGLLVTRSTQRTNLPGEFIKQLFSRPQALGIAGGFLFLLIFTALPKIPLLALSGGCGGLALMLTRQKKADDQQASTAAREEAAKSAQADDRIEDYLTVDPMELEIGLGLIRLADPNRAGDLLPRITKIRQAIASEIGIVLPKIRIRDNMKQLGENDYRVKIANNTVARGLVYPTRLLAMDSGMTTGKLQGEDTRDPTFGQPAVWIEPGLRVQAEMLGYTPVEPAAVLATHLQEIVREHADELLTRDATKHLIDELKNVAPTVVEELIPNLMKLSDVQQVLQMLLRERVPIRQLSTILESLGDYAGRFQAKGGFIPQSGLTLLTETVRNRLSRTICLALRDDESRLHVVTLDPTVEDRIASGLSESESGLSIRMSPQAVEHTCRRIADEVAKLVQKHRPPVILVSPQIRFGLKQLSAPHLPKLNVLSYNEVTRDTIIESVGIVVDTNPAP